MADYFANSYWSQKYWATSYFVGGEQSTDFGDADYLLAEDGTYILDENGQPILLEKQEVVEPSIPVYTGGGWAEPYREKVREVHHLSVPNVISGIPVIGCPRLTETFDEIEIDNDLLLMAA